MSADLDTDKKVILAFLPWDDESKWVTNEEMVIGGISSNTQATRLSELQGDGLVVSRWRSRPRVKEWSRRRVPVAPRMKVPKPRFRVTAVEPVLIGNIERVIIEAPKGALQPGMELRQA